MGRSLAGNLQQIRSAWRMDSNKILLIAPLRSALDFRIEYTRRTGSSFLCYDSGWAHSIMKTLACGVIMSRLENWHAHANILFQHYAGGMSKRRTKVHTIRNHSCSINTGLVVQQHALHWDPASVSRSYIILRSSLGQGFRTPQSAPSTMQLRNSGGE